MTALSNHLADLERAKEAHAASVAAARLSAAKALETGQLLCTAKDECSHGTWTAFLNRAGIHDRQARRLMQIARSGLKSDTVSEMGIKAALEQIAARRLPGPRQVLIACPGGLPRWREKPMGFVWPAPEATGYFHAACINLEVDEFCAVTQKPVSGTPMRLAGGAFVNCLWATLDEPELAQAVAWR